MKTIPWAKPSDRAAWTDDEEVVVICPETQAWWGIFPNRGMGTKAAWHISTKGDNGKLKVPINELAMVLAKDWPKAHSMNRSGERTVAAKKDSSALDSVITGLPASVSANVLVNLEMASEILNAAKVSAAEPTAEGISQKAEKLASEADALSLKAKKHADFKKAKDAHQAAWQAHHQAASYWKKAGDTHKVSYHKGKADEQMKAADEMWDAFKKSVREATSAEKTRRGE